MVFVDRATLEKRLSVANKAKQQFQRLRSERNNDRFSGTIDVNELMADVQVRI